MGDVWPPSRLYLYLVQVIENQEPRGVYKYSYHGGQDGRLIPSATQIMLSSKLLYLLLLPISGHRTWLQQHRPAFSNLRGYKTYLPMTSKNHLVRILYISSLLLQFADALQIP